MRIGELASQAGCDAQTVRFYEREGLLDEPRRDASGYRAYGPGHLSRLNFIRHCRSLDIPLPNIRRLLACTAAPGPSCHEVDALLDGHIALVRSRIASLQALERQLVALRQTCAGDSPDSCAILEAFVAAGERHACACHAPTAS